MSESYGDTYPRPHQKERRGMIDSGSLEKFTLKRDEREAQESAYRLGKKQAITEKAFKNAKE